MSHNLEYAVKGALMLCDKGTLPTPFQPTNCTGVKISGLTPSNTRDKIPNQHIMPFGACSLQNGKPCTPIPLEWQDTHGVKIKGGKTLLKKSCIQCGSGGKISFLNSGQIPLPPETYDELMDAHGEEEDNGWGWWDTAELIPIVGNIIGMVREAKKGNWGMVALNVVFLALDIFTLGSASLATAGVKGGIKAGFKEGVKIIGKTAAKATTKAGAKSLAKGGVHAFVKGVSKATAKLATAKSIVCVTACFTKGTLIATAKGQRPIEALKSGDLVWAFNEKTGKQALKRVVQTTSKPTDATLEVVLDNETIKTTAAHPFYTKSGWKQATDLTLEDEVQTKSGNWHRIKATNFKYQKETVYNFEVKDYHTYFVGKLKWLVHNAKVCLVALAKAGVTYAKNILNGQMFDKAMRKAYGAANSQIKMAPTIVKKKGKDIVKKGKVLDVLTDVEIISHKFTQLSEITEKTAKRYIDEIGAKYANKMTNSTKLLEQRSTKFLDKILEIPPQKNGIPKEILDHAEEAGVTIREISGKALEEFSKMNFW